MELKLKELCFLVYQCSDRKLLAQAPGETTVAAEEEAARVILRKIYGYMENRTPFDFCRQQPWPPFVSVKII